MDLQTLNLKRNSLIWTNTVCLPWIAAIIVVWVGAVSLVETFDKQNFWHDDPTFVDAWLYRFLSTNVNILLVFTVVLAVAVPTISPFISLIGALCFSLLGLVVPAFIEVITFWDRGLGPYRWRLWKNIVVGIFGVMALAFGSYTSIREIAQLYTSTSTSWSVYSAYNTMFIFKFPLVI